MLVDLFADIVDAPVFAVDKGDSRPVFQIVDVEILDQGLHHGVAEMGILKIVARVAQHKGLVPGQLQVREEGIINAVDAIVALEFHRNRFLGEGAGVGAVDGDTALLRKAELFVVIEELDMGRLLPVHPKVGAVVGGRRRPAGAVGVDACVIVEEIGGVARERNDWQCAGFVDEIGGVGATGGLVAGLDAHRLEHRGFLHRHRAGVERRCGVRIAAVQGVIDAVARGGEGDGHGRGIKSRRRGGGHLIGIGKDDPAGVGSAGRWGLEGPRAAAVARAAPGDVAARDRHIDAVGDHTGGVRQHDGFARSADLEIGMPVGALLVLVRGEDQQKLARCQRGCSEMPFDGFGIVAEAVPLELDRCSAAVIEFDIVGGVSVFIVDGLLVRSDDFVDHHILRNSESGDEQEH